MPPMMNRPTPPIALEIAMRRPALHPEVAALPYYRDAQDAVSRIPDLTRSQRDALAAYVDSIRRGPMCAWSSTTTPDEMDGGEDLPPAAIRMATMMAQKLAQQDEMQTRFKSHREAIDLLKGLPAQGVAKRLSGMPVVIEKLAGQTYAWRNRRGEGGVKTQLFDYGYFVGVNGADGELLDVYVGPEASPAEVYIVHQNAVGEGYDEDKVMFGFGSEEEAQQAYMASYGDQAQKLWGGISKMPLDAFLRWIKALREPQAVSEKSMNAADVLNGYLAKAGGEGSRGGKIVGHSGASGKPIYASSVGGSSAAATQAADKMKNMSAEEHHREAASMRGKMANAGSNQKKLYEARANAHELLASKKGGQKSLAKDVHTLMKSCPIYASNGFAERLAYKLSNANRHPYASDPNMPQIGKTEFSFKVPR